MYTPTGSDLRFSGDRYTLTFPLDRDFVYLADVLDMIRLNDMIPLNDMLALTALDDPAAGRDIGQTLAARAAPARAGCPEALIDTDIWPVRDKAAWRQHVRLQPSYGVPSLYFILHIDVTQQLLDDDDCQLIKRTWECTTSE